MEGFKRYLLSEIRHGSFEPIKLNISEPVNGRFQTISQLVDSIDMKYEFYTRALPMMYKKFIQQFPEDISPKRNVVLVNESHFVPIGGNFYACEVDPELLHRALAEHRAYVDVNKRQLVEPSENKQVIVCEVNPLNQFHIPVHKVIDSESGLSIVREGWEQLKVFNWWHFTMCMYEDKGVKKSCCYDDFEMEEIRKRAA